MKKRIILFVLSAAVLVFASCSLSAEADKKSSGDEKGLVKVMFHQVQTKALDVGYKDAEVVYFLSATPNFQRPHEIVGKVENQMLSTKKGSSYDGGYFEQGDWKFVLNAKYKIKGQGETATYSDVFATQTIDSYEISSTHKDVSFSLQNCINAGDTGNLVFDIMVPRVSDKVSESYGVKLTVTVDGTPTDLVNEYTNATLATSIPEATVTDLLEFTGTVENIPAGYHTVQFEYSYNGEKICGQTVDVRIVKDVDASISGTILTGEYISGTITVTYASDSWTNNLTRTGAESSVTSGTEITFTNTVTGGSPTSRQWYRDGALLTGETGETLKWTPTSQGVFSITCVTKVGNISKSATMNVTVLGVKAE